MEFLVSHLSSVGLFSRALSWGAFLVNGEIYQMKMMGAELFPER